MTKMNTYEVETIVTVFFKVKSTEYAKNKREAVSKAMDKALSNSKFKFEGSTQRGAYPSYVIHLS